MSDDTSPDISAPNDMKGKTPPALDETLPRLGYGHRAHCPDPKAKYGFDPGTPRTMPHDKTKRWRVTG